MVTSRAWQGAKDTRRAGGKIIRETDVGFFLSLCGALSCGTGQ